MALKKYGYKSGVRDIQSLLVAASETWEDGDFLKRTSGYLAKCTAGDKCIGVAVGDFADSVATNGYGEAQVDLSESAVFYYAVGTGTMTQAMEGTTCDLAGDDTLDVTASADDCVMIIKADVTNNAAWVRLRVSAIAAGVV